MKRWNAAFRYGRQHACTRKTMRSTPRSPRQADCRPGSGWAYKASKRACRAVAASDQRGPWQTPPVVGAGLTWSGKTIYVAGTAQCRSVAQTLGVVPGYRCSFPRERLYVGEIALLPVHPEAHVDPAQNGIVSDPRNCQKRMYALQQAGNKASLSDLVQESLLDGRVSTETCFDSHLDQQRCVRSQFFRTSICIVQDICFLFFYFFLVFLGVENITYPGTRLTRGSPEATSILQEYLLGTP